ncbi:MAG: hypothetical protein L6262_01945 [Weeksellaceae bacterium]|nr:hypothetical protein [Weeksellaceae bacterium]
MKKFVILLVSFFSFSLSHAQNIEKELKNDHELFTGKIDNSASLKVLFEKVFSENPTSGIYNVSGYSDVEGTKANFEGTIAFNPTKSKNSKDSFKIYDLKLSEKGTGKHNGVFTGELTAQKSSDKNQLKFEGTWANYGNSLKFPFYFNN